MAKPRPGSSKGIVVLFMTLWLNFFQDHHFNLSPVEGVKRLSKSGGEDTNSEQYKADNQTLLLQVCVKLIFKKLLRMLKCEKM